MNNPNAITIAVTRKPGKNFLSGISSFQFGKPDYQKALKQHDAYVETLRSEFGLTVLVMEPLEDYPDACFVEDTAVVFPEAAVLTRPGAESRRGEVDTLRAVLSEYRKIEEIEAPGTLDGGDVLMIDNHFYIGISDRTNPEGAESFGAIVEKYGKTWSAALVNRGLHLKSSVNYLGGQTIILSPDFENDDLFKAFDKIVVAENESYAANTLDINGRLLAPKGFPDTLKKLERLQKPVIELDVSEYRKMDGGLTCLSLRF